MSLRIGWSGKVEYSGSGQGDGDSVGDQRDVFGVGRVVVLVILGSALVQGGNGVGSGVLPIRLPLGHGYGGHLRRDGHRRYRIRYQQWKLPSCSSAM